ncbi:MAG: hypothetical protein IPL05_06760 [Betaproteobacteria bacterium]|nr:hypothetical protein [Betaproteobacteria bacterium]
MLGGFVEKAPLPWALDQHDGIDGTDVEDGETGCRLNFCLGTGILGIEFVERDFRHIHDLLTTFKNLSATQFFLSGDFGVL